MRQQEKIIEKGWEIALHPFLIIYELFFAIQIKFYIFDL